MKIKYIFLIFLTTFINNLSSQQQVIYNEAVNAAINTTLQYEYNIRGKSAPDLSFVDLDTVYTITNEKKDTLLYEVVFKTGNSVLLSGSKACVPILGMNLSENSKPVLYDLSEIPDGLRFLLEEYLEQLKTSFNDPGTELYHNDSWNALQKTDHSKSETKNSISPLLTSKWGQDRSNCGRDCDAYNYYVTESSNECPCLGSGRTCPAGCGAVAMAQLLFYWRSSIWNSNGFNWFEMTDELDKSSDNYKKHRNAVARLIRDCGTMINTIYCNYNTCESSSYMQEIRRVLINIFNFNEKGSILKRSHYEDEWIEMLRNNLDIGLPVLYCGYKDNNENGGHAFICDGYFNDKFHFNWGWNGDHNGYYTLGNLRPGISNYSYSHYAMFCLHPNLSHLEHYYYYYLLQFALLGIEIPVELIVQALNIPVSVSLISSDIRSSSEFRTIKNGMKKEYIARKEIILADGFTALVGSDFIARIDVCRSCSGNPGSPISQSINDLNSIHTDNFSSNSSRKISIYPNPNEGYFLIETTGEFENSYYEIYDNTGKYICSDYINSLCVEVNIPDLKSGIYFIKINTDNVVTIEKIVIK